MRLFIAVLAASALLAVPTIASGSAGVSASASATKCTPPATFPEDGGSFDSLSATGIKCKSAASIATAWAKCAAKNGKGGRCVKKVKTNYACQETATTVGTTRTSKVTCKYKKKVAKFGVTRTV